MWNDWREIPSGLALAIALILFSFPVAYLGILVRFWHLRREVQGFFAKCSWLAFNVAALAGVFAVPIGAVVFIVGMILWGIFSVILGTRISDDWSVLGLVSFAVPLVVILTIRTRKATAEELS